MKTPSFSRPARTGFLRWVLLVLVIAGLTPANLMASESNSQASVPPPPKVKVRKIPVLRLQKVELQAKTKPNRKATAQQSVDKRRRGKVVVTGSNIPQSVGEGRLTVTSSPVLIIDRREMNRTGAQTASQLFGNLSFSR